AALVSAAGAVRDRAHSRRCRTLRIEKSCAVTDRAYNCTVALRAILLPTAAARAARPLPRNAAEGNHGLAVGARQTSGPCVFGSVPSGVCRNRHFLAGHHQCLINLPAESVLDDNVRTGGFQSPVHDFALR